VTESSTPGRTRTVGIATGATGGGA
jgi:hypothetical protein